MRATKNKIGAVVVGGGVVGLSAAYFLARRGEPVTVLDHAPPGGAASSHNAGLLALGHPPLPRPGLAGQLLRLLFSPTSPLFIAPRLDPSLVPWLVGFLRACRESRFERSVRLLAELGWEAGETFRGLVESEGIECEYEQAGWLEVFRTERAREEARGLADRLRPFGYEIVELPGDELRAKEPAFAPSVLGALHHVDSAFANPGSFMEGLAAAAERHGVRIKRECGVERIVASGGEVAGVELEGGERVDARRVLLAGGVWSTGLARTAGVRVPMQAGKGYRVELGEMNVRPSTACVLAETFVAVTPLSGGLQLAGTVELSGLSLEMRRRRLDMLRKGAREYLSGVDDARELSTWCGHRPMTADGLPVVGPAPGVHGLYVATGHAMMGFLLGPVTGRLVSELMLDDRESFDLSEMSPARFVRG